MNPKDAKAHFIAALAGVAFLVAVWFGSPFMARAQQPGPVPIGAGNYGPPFSNINGHFVIGGGAPPSLNAACGTGPVAPAGTDSAYTFTSGTSTSASCTMTPATPWKARPICSVDTQTTSGPTFTIAANGAITLLGVADSTTYFVICLGQPGG